MSIWNKVDGTNRDTTTGDACCDPGSARQDAAEWNVNEVLVLQPSFSIDVEVREAPYLFDQHRNLYREGLLMAGFPG